jgi:hypothetical protein
MYMKLKDMQMLDLNSYKIKQILKKSGMNKKLINNIMRGVFTPIDYSKPRFETKVDVLKDLAKHKTEKSKDYIYNIDKNYVFPKYQLDSVRRSYQYKKFFPETYNKETGKWEGGYKPELEGAVTNDKGNVVYDEKGKIKREPTLLQKGWEKIKPLVMPGTPVDLKSQTPLPPTPGVNPELFAQANQNITQTGLTHTENALLRDDEKAMRLRQRGQA